LAADGKVYAWGANDKGQLGISENAGSKTGSPRLTQRLIPGSPGLPRKGSAAFGSPNTIGRRGTHTNNDLGNAVASPDLQTATIPSLTQTQPESPRRTTLNNPMRKPYLLNALAPPLHPIGVDEPDRIVEIFAFADQSAAVTGISLVLFLYLFLYFHLGFC
jgi:hypothetical protein